MLAHMASYILAPLVDRRCYFNSMLLAGVSSQILEPLCSLMFTRQMLGTGEAMVCAWISKCASLRP